MRQKRKIPIYQVGWAESAEVYNKFPPSIAIIFFLFFSFLFFFAALIIIIPFAMCLDSWGLASPRALLPR